MKACRVYYTGRVQGVGFRYSVRQIASEFDIAGTVRNLPDGRVELILQGDDAEREAMLQAILKSHLKGFIREIEAHDIPPDPARKGFQIIA